MRSRPRAANVLAIARATAAGGERRRHALRALQFRLLRHMTPVVAVDGDGVRYFVSTRDNGVGMPLYVYGAFEPGELWTAVCVLERSSGHPFVGGDRLFVDVGANIGTATIQAIAHHRAYDAIAYEPDAFNVELLQHNLLTNGLTERVKVVRAAVSDECRALALELSDDNFGDHRVKLESRTSVSPEPTRRVTTVPGITLDSQIEAGVFELDRIGLVSIDTQGHEAQVLAGATRLCESDVPVMLEYWPYGLRAAGGSGQLRDILARCYGRYVDLAAAFSGGRVAYRPTDELAALEDDLPQFGWANLLLCPR